MKVNYHTHTSRCQHASGLDEAYARHAWENGFEKLGYSDHVPYPFQNGYVSNIRMRVEETQDYVSSITSIKEQYQGRMEVLLGYEMEYLPGLFEDAMDNISQFGYDYLILSQHFIDTESNGNFAGNRTTDDRRLFRYVELVTMACETGKFLYIGHPDIIHYRGDSSLYKRAVRELCAVARKYHLPLEYNILGQIEQKCYPYRPFFEIVAEEGNPVILGVDAHKPEAFDNRASIQEARLFLEELSITPIEDLI